MSNEDNNVAEIVFNISGLIFLAYTAYTILSIISGGLIGSVEGNVLTIMGSFWIMVISYFIKKNKEPEDQNAK